MQEPVWRRGEGKTVYRGRVHLMEYPVTLPNGDSSIYEVEHANGGAGALVLTPDRELILNRQYRFPLDRWIYDLPGGAVDPGEKPIESAARECEEEAGVRPTALVHLASYARDPSRSNSFTHVYFCDSYEEVPIEYNDPSEQLESVRIPVADFDQLVRKGEIIDPALLLAWHTACSRGLIVLE